jgi:hypothetical protein
MFSEQEKINIREILKSNNYESRIIELKSYLRTLPQLSENGVEWAYLATEICREYESKYGKNKRR